MRTTAELARILRELRRRHARRLGRAEPSYRELAEATGWSHGIIGEYLAGRVLPPTDRFDVLVRLPGASPAEQGTLATARDRVEEARRGVQRGSAAAGDVPRQLPMDVYGFSGRADELAALDALAFGPAVGGGRGGEGGSRGGVVAVSAVSGTAGVGKTALQYFRGCISGECVDQGGALAITHKGGSCGWFAPRRRALAMPGRWGTARRRGGAGWEDCASCPGGLVSPGAAGRGGPTA